METERVIRSDSGDAHRLSLSARVLSTAVAQVKAKAAAGEALLTSVKTIWSGLYGHSRCRPQSARFAFYSAAIPSNRISPQAGGPGGHAMLAPALNPRGAAGSPPITSG